jgi:hypothetical protein
MNRTITRYYAATIIFVLLDFFLGISIRAAFLDPYPMARLAYYVFCYACLAIMLWQPAWALIIGIAESLVAVVALTLSMGVRVMAVTDEMIESGRGFVTVQEICNFLIVAGIAYLSYLQGIKLLKATKIEKHDPWR